MESLNSQIKRILYQRDKPSPSLFAKDLQHLQFLGTSILKLLKSVVLWRGALKHTSIKLTYKCLLLRWLTRLLLLDNNLPCQHTGKSFGLAKNSSGYFKRYKE